MKANLALPGLLTGEVANGLLVTLSTRWEDAGMMRGTGRKPDISAVDPVGSGSTRFFGFGQLGGNALVGAPATDKARGGKPSENGKGGVCCVSYRQLLGCVSLI